jgi:hypothetical protein
MHATSATLIPLVLAIATFLLQAAPPPWPPLGRPQRVDLCAVVKDPRRFNDKYVEVSGIWHFGSGGISNPNCDRMVTDGYSWPPGLLLAAHRMSDSAVKALNGILLKAAEQAKAEGRDRLCLRVAGVVEAKRKYQVGTLPDGSKHGFGFGHLGVWPAKLHTIEVLSVGVCPDPMSGLEGVAGKLE